MMHKITKGKSFAGVLKYVFSKGENSEPLELNGVMFGTIPTMAACMDVQASMNPSLKKNKVCHVSLNFSAENKVILTNEMMLRIAHEYMQRMGFKNTQYVIVRHHDRDHPHIHIVINRVDNDGKTISDKNDRDRGKQICLYLTKKYGLHIAAGKDHVKRDRLRGGDKTKYEIYDAVCAVLPKCKNWGELQKALLHYGVEVEFKYRSGTLDVQGVKFIKDGIAFSGSKVDRNLSYSKLSRKLEANLMAAAKKETKPIKATRVAKRSKPASAPKPKLVHKVVQVTDSLGNILNQDVYVPDTVSESAEDDYTTEDELIEEKKWTWGHGFKR